MPKTRSDSSDDSDKLLLESIAEIEQLFEQGEFAKARARLSTLSRNTRGRGDVCRLWGRHYLSLDELRKAAQWFEKATLADPGDANNYLWLANTFSMLNKADEALSTLEMGARVATDPIKIFERLEMQYYMMDAPEKAHRLIEDIKTRYAGKPELLFKQGEAAHALDCMPTAIDFFRQAIDHQYVGPNQLIRLATALGRCGEVDGALHFFKKALIGEGYTPRILDDLAAYLKLGARTGDEKLITAVDWKLGKVSGNPQSVAQPRFLNLSDETLEAYLKEWLEGIDEDADYLHFCEFYKNLIFFKTDHQSFTFDGKSALHHCIGKLKEKEYDGDTYYQAWLALAHDDVAKANTLFRLARDLTDLSDSMRTGLNMAFDLIEHKNRELPAVDGGVDGDLVAGAPVSLTTRLKSLKIAPSSGLDELVDRMFDILCGAPNRSVILTGASGVGKTAAVMQLAWRLARGKCPSALKGFQLQQTSTAALLSGAKYLGTWQERVLDLVRANAFRHRRIIYFEDIVNIAAAGRVMEDRSGFLDVLLPEMERGEIAIIGELLPQQTHLTLWREPRFRRLVTELPVKEPDAQQLVEILRHIAELQQKAKTAEVTDDSIQEAITLSQVFEPYKAFPGKAIDLLSGAARSAKKASQERMPKVNSASVMSHFCVTSGVPEFIVKPEMKLDRPTMERFFTDRVLGQDGAIGSLMNAVTVFKSRLCDPQKPIRSFLFVGPTGVGKTEAAKALAEYLFGSADRLLRLNMSEYNTPAAVERLIGSKGGRAGAGISFLEKLRAQPFSVVLLDEVEKADASVSNLLLQILDEGELCDDEGTPAYFQSSIVIMTSNLGARRYSAQSIGFDSKQDVSVVRKEVMDDVKEFFSPEIFNRFDEVLVFDPLIKDVVETIVNREIGKVMSRRGVLDRNLDVEVDPLVIQHVMKTGFDPKYGARHIKRAVESSIAVPLAIATSGNAVEDGDLIRINLRSGAPVADIVRISAAAVRMRESEDAGDGHRFEDLADKELRRYLESTAIRIQAIKSKLGYEGLATEFEDLKTEMASPSFWDRPTETRPRLKRYSEINRIIERVQKWERLLEDVGQKVQASKPSRAGSRKQGRIPLLGGLLLDLESAEMETLLQGKYDSADAFMIIRTAKTGAQHLDWMISLTDMYTKWARRRGFQWKIIGEQPAAGGQAGLLLHIAGMNAFGLLKNEHGIHRERRAVASGNGASVKKRRQHFIEAEVAVFPDIDVRDKAVPDPTVSIRRVSPEKRGWKIKTLSRELSLGKQTAGAALAFLASKDVVEDREILTDLYKSYAHFMIDSDPELRRGDGDAWGSLVRTVETSPKAKVEDHRTGLVLTDMKKYLSGNIDALLLERLV